MKKTLFAMLTLALCGSAFAENYKVSDFSNVDTQQTISNAVITVDTSDTCMMSKMVTLNAPTIIFDKQNVWNADWTVGGSRFSLNSPNITATAETKEDWIQKLTSPDAQPITLFSGSFSSSKVILLFGTERNASFELTDGLTVKNLGLITDVSTMVDGDIAILKSGTTFSLVGKGLSKPVPEPATATLSLLALAGLASRRKRK